MSWWVVPVISLILVKEDVSKMNHSNILSCPCLRFWRDHLWILKPVGFYELPSFAQFIACRKTAASPPFPLSPPPLTFLLSFGPSTNDKRSTGRGGLCTLRSFGAQHGLESGKGGVHPYSRQSGSNRSLRLFPRWKALVMRLMLRRDRNTTSQGFLTSFIFGLHIHRQRSSLLRSSRKPFHMHVSKVNLLSLIPRRREEINIY